MQVGDVNRNGQVLLRKTSQKSTTHRFATVWVMQCEAKKHEYGSNSCDAHQRLCPSCVPAAKPGEPF